MVETIQTKNCNFDFSISPKFVKWEKAKNEDLLKLKINTL